jgi:superfamily II DNA or RNA helicase
LVLKGKLHRGLRARPKGYWAATSYKKKKWDGFKEFFNEKTGIFLTGLLPEVLLSLRVLDRPYTIEDRTYKPVWLNNEIDDDFLDQWRPTGYDPLKLHDFQPDLVNQGMKYNRGIIKAPTGAGKTYIMISMIHNLPPGTPVLFLTKGKQLVKQNYDEMKLWGVKNVGLWCDGYKELNDVMCATIHPATFEGLADMLPKFKVIFVDEVHDAVSDVPVSAYRKMTAAAVRIGFSATPFRWNTPKEMDKVHMFTVKGHFGPVLKTRTTESGFLTTKDLQDRGILSKSDCTFYPITNPDLAYEPFQEAIKLGLEQNFDFHKTVVRLARKCEGRTLIIVERIEQGEYLHQLMPEAHWIQGKDSLAVRDPVIEALRKSEHCCAIVMRQIITAGINVKIHNLINASGGKAPHNFIQQLGRGLRTADDKDILKFYDFIFKINPYLWRHSDWRVKILENEGHAVTIKDSIDF